MLIHIYCRGTLAICYYNNYNEPKEELVHHTNNRNNYNMLKEELVPV